MAAFDFPPTPAVGTLYPLVAEVGKPQYRWNGSEWVAATLDPAGYVRKSGDAMTGALSLAGDPTQALHAVPLQYLNAQKQRVSLAGGKSFDIQVPAGAVAARLTGMIVPTTATAFSLGIQLSLAAGVFRSTVGDYVYSGYYHTTAQNPTAVAAANAISTVGFMLLGASNHATLTTIFDGIISLKRPDTGHFFTADTRLTSGHAAVGQAHYFHYHYITAASSALEVLALRILDGNNQGGNWAAESYLTVEWL